MRKGYPASEYYGPPTPPTNEVVEIVKTARHKPSPHRVEERDSLRESFVDKIDFVTDLWKKVEDPNVADLPYEEFEKKLLEINNDLGDVIPNAGQKQAEYIKLKSYVDNLRSSFDYENDKRRNDGKSYTEFDMLDLLYKKLNAAEEKLSKKLEDSDFEFIQCLTNFTENILAKKAEVSRLRKAKDSGEGVSSEASFFKEVSSCYFESALNKRSDSPIIEDSFVKRFLEVLQEKIIKGDNIFDNIEIGSFDVIFNFDRKEFIRLFQGDEFSDLRASGGFHLTQTPFIFIIRDEGVDNVEMAKTHERGHNMVSSVESSDIHNAICPSSVLRKIEFNKTKFINRFGTPEALEFETTIRGYVRSIIRNLNAEISADAKNIVNGYPASFINHFRNLISDLEKETKKESEVSEAVSKFREIIKEEIDLLTDEAVDLSIKIITYAHLARKHGFEDEFCSILVLTPTSDKYLRRFFKIKLGEDFDLEKANKEIDFAELSTDMPEWFIEQTRQCFGPNSIFVDKSKIDKSENPPSQGSV